MVVACYTRRTHQMMDSRRGASGPLALSVAWRGLKRSIAD